jgi:hypothetical protein
MTFDGVKAAYFQGVPDPDRIEPESYTLDAAILARPGNADLQIDFKLDYKRNLERYPLYVYPHPETKVARRLGTQRSLLHSTGRGSIPPRRPGRPRRFHGYRPFRP